MSNLYFKKLRYLNFMAFGNVWTELDLTSIGTTHIIGENIDEGGSSGAGKSTIMNALSYVIYDQEPEGIKKDMLINNINDAKNIIMAVELYFSVGTDEYYLKRFRGKETGAIFKKKNVLV